MKSRSRVLAPLLAVPVLLSLLVAAISPVLPVSAAPGAPAGSSFHRLHFLYNKTTGQYSDDALAQMSSSAGDEAEVEALLARKVAELDATRITFRSGITIHPEPGMAASVREALAVPGDASSARFWLIQFRYPFPTEARTRLEEAGAAFYDYVDVCAFFAKVPPGALSLLEEMLDDGLIRYVGGIPPEAKVALSLAAETAREPEAEKAIVVLTFDEPGPAQMEELGRWMAVEGRSTGPIHVVEGTASGASIRALASLDNVRWVEERGQAELGNLDGGMAVGGDVVRAEFDGTGVQVMVVDSGIARQGDIYHPDLLGERIVDQYDFQNEDGDATDDYVLNNGHGTHVAGTIGGRYNPGDGHSIQSYQGLAPGVDFLIYRLFGNDSTFDPQWFEDALELGTSGGRTAHVSSNSWGYGDNGEYEVVSDFADAAVRGQYNGQFVNIVAAAMNKDRLVRSPGTGKNVIAVGAVKDGNSPANTLVWNPYCGTDPEDIDYNWPPGERVCYSNHGPVDTDGDGQNRIKPDLVAPGAMITSAAPWYDPFTSDYYRTTHGTSMATPHVSGAIAQLLDAYSEVEGGALFDWPEMVKAMLLATAADVGGDTDYYGHGLLDAYHAIYAQTGVDEPMDVWAGSVSETDETHDFSFYVPDGYEEVRVVLTWADPPGATEAINDLDIFWVKDRDGVTRGEALSYDDNVEYVRILDGNAPGTWTVRVRGTSVAETEPGPQPFALAAHVILAGADLSIRAQPSSVPGMGLSLVPGGALHLHQYVSNSGYTAGGSYAQLHAPEGFNVMGVALYTQDGVEHWYDASELHHVADTAPNDWYVAVGDTLEGFERHVRWSIDIDEGTECGSYQFESSAHWLAVGEQQSSDTVVTLIPVACHFTYLPLVFRGH